MQTNLGKGGETLQSAKNTRSRKYQLTINNPLEKGYNHEKIRSVLEESNPVYFCLCDETGENGTPHTHIYVCYSNAVYFSTMKNRFETAHIEAARGSSQENRDYIRKEGAYADSKKKETNHIETFEEYGKMPLDKAAKNETVSQQVLQMIQDGCTDTEILAKCPSCWHHLSNIERTRQTLLEELYRNSFRQLQTTYIYGETGTGKTRFVMDKYGYSNVYKVTNYEHPFDSYKGEDVLLFDEFRSSLPLQDMLQYIDGYPCRLPARYADKVACYTKVYIVSNIPKEAQYKNMQTEQPASWEAFLRRIHHTIRFDIINGTITQIEEIPTDFNEVSDNV